MDHYVGHRLLRLVFHRLKIMAEFRIQTSNGRRTDTNLLTRNLQRRGQRNEAANSPPAQAPEDVLDAAAPAQANNDAAALVQVPTNDGEPGGNARNALDGIVLDGNFRAPRRKVRLITL